MTDECTILIKRSIAVLLIVITAFAFGCGDDDDGGETKLDGGGTGGSSGSAGSVAGSGGSGGVGGSSGVGGSGGSAGASMFDPADHCAPGDYLDALSFSGDLGPNHTLDCLGADRAAAIAAGVPANTEFDSLDVNSIELAAPLSSGHTSAASFEIEYHGSDNVMRFEIWGTNARCGAGSSAMLLFSAILAQGKQIVCVPLTSSAGYTHLLPVQRQVAQNPSGSTTVYTAGATFCPLGTCP